MSLDRTSNMLSAIKNAAMTGNDFLELVHTKECEGIANVLKEKGFLNEVKVFKEKDTSHKSLRLGITKDEGLVKITDIKRISKPGRRVYIGSGEIVPITGGSGVIVISTSRGIMSGEEARKKKLGGEFVCKVY